MDVVAHMTNGIVVIDHGSTANIFIGLRFIVVLSLAVTQTVLLVYNQTVTSETTIILSIERKYSDHYQAM